MFLDEIKCSKESFDYSAMVWPITYWSWENRENEEELISQVLMTYFYQINYVFFFTKIDTILNQVYFTINERWESEYVQTHGS